MIKENGVEVKNCKKCKKYTNFVDIIIMDLYNKVRIRKRKLP